jgi:CheY-like chemotaxis protein
MMHEVQGLRSGPIPDEFPLLLVQPESERRACYVAALIGAGFAVKVADDGLQAASGAPSWKPAMVVTDLVLPGLTGLELCCRLREDETAREAIIIGLAGWTPPTEHARMLEAGFDLLLPSGCNPTTFVAEVLRVRSSGMTPRRRIPERHRVSPTPQYVHVLDPGHVLHERRLVAMTREEAFRRIRSDYLELPGLSLTVAQAARLWAIGIELAATLLDDLVNRGLLARCGDQYVRR